MKTTYPPQANTNALKAQYDECLKEYRRRSDSFPEYDHFLVFSGGEFKTLLGAARVADLRKPLVIRRKFGNPNNDR